MKLRPEIDALLIIEVIPLLLFTLWIWWEIKQHNTPKAFAIAGLEIASPLPPIP